MASTYTNLNIHLIFATKDRANLIDAGWRDDLHGYLGGCAREIGVLPICIGGTGDHVHMLIGIKATQCVADAVRDIKTAASKWASGKRPGFTWQVGYGAFSFGRSELGRLVRYVENQEEHHRTVSSADELRAILAEEGIAYNSAFFE